MSQPTAAPTRLHDDRPANRISRWRRRLMVALATAIVAAFIFGGQAMRSLSLLVHTRDVQRQAEHLARVIVDAETGQRGYILTGNPAFLEPFDRSRKIVADIFDTIRATVADNAEQTRRLEKLQPLIQAKYQSLSRGADLQTAGQHDAAVAFVSSMAGKRLMTDIRQRIDDFTAVEGDLLLRRQTSYEVRAGLAMATLLIAGLLLVGLFLYEAQDASLRRRQLIADKRELERQVRERTADMERERSRVQALLDDVNHRIGNTLAMATSLLNLQARRSPHAEVREALGDSINRIRAIAAGQRRLRLDEHSDVVAARAYFENFLQELRSFAGNRRIVIASDIEDIALSGKHAVSYIILANELITNALKHAFPGNVAGRITVSLRHVAHPDRAINELTVEDDGKGSGETSGPEGVGTTVTTRMLRALNATMTVAETATGSPRPGYRATIAIPADPDPPAPQQS